MSAEYLRDRDPFDLTEAELHLADPCPIQSGCTVCYPGLDVCEECGGDGAFDDYSGRQHRCTACNGDRYVLRADLYEDDKREFDREPIERVDPQTGFVERV